MCSCFAIMCYESLPIAYCSPSSTLAFASSCAIDQWRRPSAGYLTLCPSVSHWCIQWYTHSAADNLSNYNIFHTVHQQVTFSNDIIIFCRTLYQAQMLSTYLKCYSTWSSMKYPMFWDSPKHISRSKYLCKTYDEEINTDIRSLLDCLSEGKQSDRIYLHNEVCPMCTTLGQ